MTIKEQFAEVMLEVRERVLDAAGTGPDSELGRVLETALADATERCGNLAYAKFGLPPGVVPIRAKVTQYTPSLERDKDGDLRPIRVALEVANTHTNLLALAELDGAVTVMPHQLRLTGEQAPAEPAQAVAAPAEAPRMEPEEGRSLPEVTEDEERFADAYFRGYDQAKHGTDARNPFTAKDERMPHEAWIAGFRQGQAKKPWCTDVAWAGSYESQGFAAHGTVKRSENPYPADCEAHERWRAGFLFAEEQALEGFSGDVEDCELEAEKVEA